MMGHFVFAFAVAASLFFVLAPATEAALINDVNKAFQSVYGRLPTAAEWKYWAQRVQTGEKKTYSALAGAMGYQKAHGNGSQAARVLATYQASGGFELAKHYYPSSANPNFLPTGTLVKSPSNPAVYYIKDGKKSWVLPDLLNRWLGENHFFKHDIILTIPDADVKRYPQTKSVNAIYIGKVLKHPDGTQYYIDDKLRKRKLSASVRSALKFPAKNLYSASATHLQEFATGPALTDTKKQPGGMVIYDGPYHGGRIWRIEEGAGGALTKRLFLSDYLYEAWGYPDESQRVAVNAVELARYTRGTNIERYPDGWVVGLGGKKYVVQGGALRLIGSPTIFSAMGYKDKYVLTVFPEFLKKYPIGHPIAAFKQVVVSSAISKSTPTAAPSAATNLVKVRPHIRAIITEINDIALPIFDKQISAADNKFWVDYVYNGEVNNKADLVAAMKTTKASGNKPSRTSRTAVLDSDVLKSHWFPYLFYFVHQSEPSDDAKAYWYSRINGSDRNTIEKLGGTLQWLKDTTGKTHK